MVSEIASGKSVSFVFYGWHPISIERLPMRNWTLRFPQKNQRPASKNCSCR